MGAVKVSDLAGQRLYLDTNVFIYAVERHPDYLARLDLLFAQIDSGISIAVTSEITLAECLVKPFADKDLVRQQLYQAAITPRPHFDVVSVSRAILITAAQIRGIHKPRLPDAIHPASALASSCQTLVTNDFLIKPMPGIHVVQISDLTV